MSTINAVEEMLVGWEDHTSPAFDERTLNAMHAAMGAKGGGSSARRSWSFFAKVSAVAAMVLLCFALLWVWRSSSPSQVPDTGKNIPIAVQLQQERLLAETYFADQNLAGLHQLLRTGLPPTQSLVSGMIVKLNDRSALELLHRLAATWTGDPGENPFQTAIDQLTVPEPNESVPAPNEVTNDIKPTMKQRPPQSETGVAGVVVDELTGEPIVGAQLFGGVSDPNYALTDVKGSFTLTGLRPSADAYICIIAPGYTSKRIIQPVIAGQIRKGIRIRLGRGSRVAGIVSDVHGLPVGRAEVETFHFTNRPVFTDAEGRYEIDGLNPLVDQYLLHVTHPNYPAISTAFTPGPVGQAVQVDPVLKPGVAISGTVTNAAGEPLNGVKVANTTSGAMWNCLRSRTDAQGSYTLKNVDVGEFVLWAVQRNYAPFVHKTTLLEAEGDLHLDIQMVKATPLQGRVIDQAGQPVPQVRVIIDEYEDVRNMDCRRARTDVNGVFILPDTPAEGALSLRVYGQGVSARDFPVDWNQDPLVLQVSRAGRIYGQVVDAETGQPIPSFTVKMTFSKVEKSPGGYSSSWNRQGHLFESTQGQFDTGREDLAVGGGYRMTVIAEGYDRLTLDPARVQTPSAEPERTVFALRKATVLAARVVDPAGHPVSEATIGVFSESERSEPMHWTRFAADERGVFVLEGLGEDQGYVQITAPGYADYLCYRSDLIDESGDPVDVILQPGATLRGRVVDRQGEPLAGIRVHASPVGQRHDLDLPPFARRFTRTNKEGFYELGGLTAGRLHVCFETPERENLAKLPCTVGAGETKELNLDLGSGLVLTAPGS